MLNRSGVRGMRNSLLGRGSRAWGSDARTGPLAGPGFHGESARRGVRGAPRRGARRPSISAPGGPSSRALAEHAHAPVLAQALLDALRWLYPGEPVQVPENRGLEGGGGGLGRAVGAAQRLGKDAVD